MNEHIFVQGKNGLEFVCFVPNTYSIKLNFSCVYLLDKFFKMDDIDYCCGSTPRKSKPNQIEHKGNKPKVSGQVIVKKVISTYL